MRSEGVTAVTDAATPAVMPARRFRIGDNVPVSGSANISLIWSKNKNRTPSFPTEPYQDCWLLFQEISGQVTLKSDNEGC